MPTVGTHLRCVRMRINECISIRIGLPHVILRTYLRYVPTFSDHLFFGGRELSEKKGGFYTTPSHPSIIRISNQLNRFLHIHINEATKSDCIYINVRVHYYYNTFISLRQWHFVKSSSIIILSKQPSFPRDIPDRDKGKPRIDDSREVKVYLFIANNEHYSTIRL